ncbi:[citrate (pro-3S)-lyase] ligase [Aequitasia blattaphilus]|uniref:[Citrate [pro-3S]-lyase] ligase n=1 Tax=Aequitasia blattaphilus TaxID=2949332 RepID=A0ABT1EBR6_9FIRM|nr:[citrate (pro-3S)-lyase] ligase [Aequitasia blattaphilus]MCP1102377.1 [citrate (pro-3S)-lyase] ligase [Aequitasia blattaphilus]MCR8615017.1 [citrate (pro-3S)-lyase] ligase [Aequitasia blattaphilus]
MEYNKITGEPFTEDRREMLISFLKENQIDYDSGIQYSVLLLNEDDQVLGTGSIEDNVLKCFAISQEARGMGLMGVLISELTQYAYERGRTNLFVYTKPENSELFEQLGFYSILETKEVLLMENSRSNFQEFKGKLGGYSQRPFAGAVVMNCDPFTWGHRYLVEEGLKHCEFLHIFVLGDHRSFFTPKQRYEMVQKGVKNFEPVKVHMGNNYMVSAATFPTYFRKNKDQALRANCRLDLHLFGQEIAPVLGIKKRLIGTEPNCKITNQYNAEMKKILPQYGIEVVEIPRKQWKDEVISASRVRTYYQEGQWDKIKSLVPKSTLDHLLSLRE